MDKPSNIGFFFRRGQQKEYKNSNCQSKSNLKWISVEWKTERVAAVTSWLRSAQDRVASEVSLTQLPLLVAVKIQTAYACKVFCWKVYIF